MLTEPDVLEKNGRCGPRRKLGFAAGEHILNNSQPLNTGVGGRRAERSDGCPVNIRMRVLSAWFDATSPGVTHLLDESPFCR